LGDPVNFADPTGHVFSGLKKAITNLIDIPKARNIPRPNSLESLPPEMFSEISKYLGRPEMDSLAQVSRRMNELSVNASLDNLTSRLKSFVKSPPDEYIYNFQYRIYDNGVGSSALKKIDPTVKGKETFAKYVAEVQQDISNNLNPRNFPDLSLRRREHNITTAEHLLLQLQIIRG
jgi:hypothetical protein